VYKFPTDSDPTDTDYRNSFDYVDPQFTPASRTLQGPPGHLFARYRADATRLDAFNYPVADSANFAVENWIEFTIKRVMCPRVPWLTIQSLQNRVNIDAWTPQNFSIDGLAPFIPVNDDLQPNTFPAGTLRFDYAETIPRLLPAAYNSNGDIYLTDAGAPSARPVRCYDIVYHFTWRLIWDVWYEANPQADEVGQQSWLEKGPDWITWNMVFTGPFSFDGPINNDFTPVGWYSVRYDDRGFFTTSGGRPRYLTDNDPSPLIDNGYMPIAAATPFDALFLEDAY
jgi:hypothetical protein